ncbi:MAG: hypothetical protein EXS02_03875 [Planctomycetes bacterium]|nr:hypothetical protein [Planctomycetota bacterium]
MDLLVAICQTAAFFAVAIALGFRRWQKIALMIVFGSALLSGLAVFVDGTADRTLESVHTYSGYVGNDLEPSAVHAKTGTTSAPFYAWPLPFFLFAGISMFFLLRVRLPAMAAPNVGQPAALVSGLYLPFGFAVLASAAWIGMQLLAAPAVVVQPYGIDRFLWPAGLLLTMCLARSGAAFGRMFLLLSLGLVLQRLPLAIFSKLASDGNWGTSLDIHKVVDVVHPLTKLQFKPRLTPGCSDQQFWLIWAEHVLAYPAFYLLSFTGIAFAAYMIQKFDRMQD